MLAAIGSLATGLAAAQAGPRAYALVGNTLLPFDVEHPQLVGTPIPITGMFGGEIMVGIDIRPMNGHLYGIAISQAGGSVQLYHIGLQTGVAVRLGNAANFYKNNGVTLDLIVPGNFDVDFDPSRDQLRVVNDAGQNFRLDPNTGDPVDGDTVAPGVNMDPPIVGGATPITGAAFTNNDEIGSSSPLLFTLSPAANTLNYQDRFNGGYNGIQMAPVAVTLNGATLDFAAVNGFDIGPNIRAIGSTAPHAVGSGHALLSLTPTGGPGLYTINLETGVATFAGALGGSLTAPVRGMTLQGERAPGGVPAIALAYTDIFPGLRRFNTGAFNAGSVTGTITGLAAGYQLVGIDWRPQTGQLYGLALNPALELMALYRISPEGFTATLVGFVAANATPLLQSASTAGFGFDFDPTTDTIRVVTSAQTNFRINPTNATVINNVVDTTTGTVQTAAAYTNNFAQTLGTGAPTTLYTLDPTTNTLRIQHPPNNGTTTAGIPVTLNGSPVDFSNAAGFDIPSSVRVATAGAPATGRGYVTLSIGDPGRIYAIDLATAALTPISGALQFDPSLRGLAVGEGPLTETALTLTSSANPSSLDQPVTLTATLVPADATGTVSFTLGDAPIAGCEARPIAGGVATCATAFGTAGTLALTAVYNGDNGHLPDLTTLNQAVVGRTSTATLTAQPTEAAPGRIVTLVAMVGANGGGGGTPTGTVTFFSDGTSIGSAPLIGGQATLGTSTLPVGVHQITAVYGGDAALAASTAGPVPVTIGVIGPLTQYFAEGASGFFHTEIGLLNASDAANAQVSVWLYPEDATPVEILMTLPPLGRHTLDLDTVVANAAGVSALITSDRPIAATRQMIWGEPVFGSTLESGIPNTSATWYFAEGATGAFSLFYLIQNPGPSPATVTLTHLLEGGAAPVVQQVVVPPFSRHTVAVNEVPALAHASMSTAITSDAPIVAERAMYVSGPRLFEGGASSRGATSVQTTWSFAEGATGFFHTYLLLGNPNADAASITVRYLLPGGAAIVKAYDVPGRARRTIDVNGEDAQLASTAVGMTVLSTQPIVAERAMWWGEPWHEGSASLGSVETGYLWAIGEGAEGGPSSESTFVLVANASSIAGTVTVTVCYDDGTRQQRDYAMAGDARLTVRIGDDFAQSRNQRFSVLVESVTNGMPITVDVSRYQSADVFLGAGGAASATRIVR
jgi:hypothetical protein